VLWRNSTFVTGVTLHDKTHKCDKVCCLCTATPPSTKDQTKYCGTCKRRFLSVKCFQNHLTLEVKGKLVCQWRKVSRNCNYLVNERFKKFCNFCSKKQLQATFATWLHWNLASCRTRFCTFSSIRSAHKILKSVMGLLRMYRTAYVLSKCILNVKPWMIWVSIWTEWKAYPHVLARHRR